MARTKKQMREWYAELDRRAVEARANWKPAEYEIRYKISAHPRLAAEGKMAWYVYTKGTHDSKGCFDTQEAAEAFINHLKP